jgi:methylated-DNA-[protein]-cysteine S-methyltransferase
MTECRPLLARLRHVNEHRMVELVVRQVREYFLGKRRAFDVALNAAGTGFQRRVWKRMLEIPYGGVASYGDLAKSLGGVNLARAVGSATSVNPIALVIPCHRVTGSNGTLCGLPVDLRFSETCSNLSGDASVMIPSSNVVFMLSASKEGKGV